MSHRLPQWATSAPELEDEVALANIALDLLGQARLLLARAAAADGTGRGEDSSAYFRDEPSSATSGWPSSTRRLRRADGPAAGLLHLAAGAAPAAGRLARPGAGGGRRQGRQGGDLPPRLRRAVGGPAGRRDRVLPRADAGRARRGLAAASRSCSARTRWSRGWPTPGWPPTPPVCGASSTTSSSRCCPRPRWTSRTWPAGVVGRDRPGRRAHRGHGPAAGRAAERGAGRPGGDVVTAGGAGRTRRRRAVTAW